MLRNAQHPNDTTVLLTAPTGTAAFGVGGFTVYSALKIPRKLKYTYESLTDETLNTLQSKLGSLKILIIDEISMIDRKVMNYIHGRLKQLKQYRSRDRTAWFGNVCVLAVGDFHQLPPCKAKSLCVPNREDGIDIWHDNFKIVQLEKIMRQKDDISFAQTLNRLRVKKKSDRLSEVDDNVLRSRSNLADIPDKVLHVFALNKYADAHNGQMLLKYCSNPRTLPAQDYVKDPESGRWTLCPHPKKGTTSDLLDNLLIDIGARVMMTRNVDVTDGLVNGAFGEVVGIDQCNLTAPATTIYVKFDSQKTGQKQNRQPVPNIPDVAIAVQPYEDVLETNSNVRRRQFPLKLAWGCTIHKCQGMTTEQCVFDMKRVFQAGQAYVALSRVTSLSGLYIINYDPNLIYNNAEIDKALKQMQNFTVQQQNIQLPNNALTAMHHNVQGLRSKLLDINSNDQVHGNDVFMVTETWLKPEITNQAVHIEKYNLFRNDRPSNDGRGGVAIYTSDTINAAQLDINIAGIEQIAVSIEKRTDSTNSKWTMATVYRPPAQPLHAFLPALTQLLQCIEITAEIENVIVAGDFNENLLDDAHKPIHELFQQQGYRQHVTEITTRYGSLLDAVYTKTNETVHAAVVPTYYSDHEAVQITMN